jgi:hypothetical protein
VPPATQPLPADTPEVLVSPRPRYSS